MKNDGDQYQAQHGSDFKCERPLEPRQWRLGGAQEQRARVRQEAQAPGQRAGTHNPTRSLRMGA